MSFVPLQLKTVKFQIAHSDQYIFACINLSFVTDALKFLSELTHSAKKIQFYYRSVFLHCGLNFFLSQYSEGSMTKNGIALHYPIDRSQPIDGTFKSKSNYALDQVNYSYCSIILISIVSGTSQSFLTTTKKKIQAQQTSQKHHVWNHDQL